METVEISVTLTAPSLINVFFWYVLWLWGRCVRTHVVCQSKCVWFFAFPAGPAVTKHFLWGQLLDTVQPHTYSNSLIHKSHRLTLGSPRCPDSWEQKPREESRQEEEEVSESWERGGEECTRCHTVLSYSLSLSSTLFIVSHCLSITQAQSH